MSLKGRLAAGELILGCFVKTPHPAVVELLSLSDLDCIVLDAEHAPFDRTQLDLCILAARAAGKPVLVRPQAATPERILDALDLGADGVLLPHVRSPEEASQLVKWCFYGPGGRGFAGSTRAAGHTTKGMARARADARDIIVLAQIEDAEALSRVGEIAALEGIDALFIGRADLTISLNAESPDDSAVVQAVNQICAAAGSAGKRVGMFLGRPADVREWCSKGANLFLLSSDHEFLLKGAAALCAAVKG